LEILASSTNRNSDALAAEAIEEYVAVQEWQIAGIEEAIRSIDEGTGVSHEQVADWVRSWGTDRELPIPKPKTG
jgi:predicted transcriptional regulator